MEVTNECQNGNVNGVEKKVYLYGRQFGFMIKHQQICSCFVLSPL